MIVLPLPAIEWIYRVGPWTRPQFLVVDVAEAPDDCELIEGLVLREVRGGYVKWAHLRCPRCDEHIQISLAGKERWMVRMDMLRRPTISPSIWQTGSCGAHFFVRRGEIEWCQVAGRNNR